MRFLVIGLIRFYQRFISPLFPPVCRYRPTCSHYALDAVKQYGAVRGMWLATLRICRCNPFSDGGWDPVPQTFDILGRHRNGLPPDPLFYTAEGIYERLGVRIAPRKKWCRGKRTHSKFKKI